MRSHRYRTQSDYKLIESVTPNSPKLDLVSRVENYINRKNSGDKICRETFISKPHSYYGRRKASKQRARDFKKLNEIFQNLTLRGEIYKDPFPPFNRNEWSPTFWIVIKH